MQKTPCTNKIIFEIICHQDQLLAACKAVADQIAKLVQGVKGSLANPESPAAQLSLISASEEFIQVPFFSTKKKKKPPIQSILLCIQLSHRCDVTKRLPLM